MITSNANSRMKQVILLNQKSKARKKEDVFVVEGIKMFLEAPRELVREVYISESFYQKWDQKELLEQYPYEIVADDVFRKISDTQTPQGILCVVRQQHYSLDQLLQKENPLFLLLEDLQDPGNLGTIVRTGEGAGVDAVLMSRDTVDIYNPKTIRATMGSIYRVPFLYVDDMGALVEQLNARNIHTYAAHLKGKDYFQGFSYLEGTAFLIGNEGNGLKQETADRAERYVKIPMEGKVESLNAAVAASLLMYTAAMERRGRNV